MAVLNHCKYEQCLKYPRIRYETLKNKSKVNCTEYSAFRTIVPFSSLKIGFLEKGHTTFSTGFSAPQNRHRYVYYNATECLSFER